MDKYKILLNSISEQNYYCEGIWGGGANNYLLGAQISVAKSKIKFSHSGSSMLDKINSFDLAEIANAHLGQINIITVSSFCGPGGLIWGYDLFPIEKKPYQLNLRVKNKEILIYSLECLTLALKKLLGTVSNPRFPFFPGSHVPCASKYITSQGTSIIYAAEGIGIPMNRDRHACLLMEDVGYIPLDVHDKEKYKNMILKNIVKSVVTIGINQRVEFKEIFIGLRAIDIDQDEIGCAMAISPYFNIARNAVPEVAGSIALNLKEWENRVNNNFLYKNEIYQ